MLRIVTQSKYSVLSFSDDCELMVQVDEPRVKERSNYYNTPLDSETTNEVATPYTIMLYSRKEGDRILGSYPTKEVCMYVFDKILKFYGHVRMLTDVRCIEDLKVTEVESTYRSTSKRDESIMEYFGVFNMPSHNVITYGKENDNFWRY